MINYVIVGLHIAEASKQMNLDAVPVVVADHLSEAQQRILRIAYDRIAEEAEWDKEQLALEFKELQLIIPDLSITGFDQVEIDLTLDILEDHNPEDDLPIPSDGPLISNIGDLWILGDHKLYCGSSLEEDSFKALMGEEKANMVFTDAPYNVPIDGHVGGKGNIKHDEFMMASGEMSPEEFIHFLTDVHVLMAQFSNDGTVIFSCMDWRHITEITTAANNAALTMLNMCVWVKNNGGMGSLYRSRHELVFVFKNGKAKHINNVELGKHGRYRTNVWEYAGVNAFGDRSEELKLHPTVKPVEMVLDAIKDCSRRGGIILDPFGGSGTTLIAAEQTDRKARLIELDSKYCDVIIRRWQELTGNDAIHVETGLTFNAIAEKEMSNEP